MRLKYLDVLKTIGIIGVVVIHSSAPLIDKSIVGSHIWWVGNVFDSLFRISVPLLFMVSGALLLEKKDVGLKNFYMKRLSPLMFAFVVWSVIYFVHRNIDYPQSFTLNILVRSIISGDIYGRLWFFYTIIGLYLVTPFLRVFVKNAKYEELNLYLILWFATTVGSGFFNHFYNLNIAFNLTFVNGYIGYFILGYYLRISEYQIKNTKLGPLLLLLNTITVVGTFFLSNSGGENNLYFYNNLSPNVILTSVLVFIFIKSNVKGTSGVFEKEIGNNSLGIYVIHSLVMIWLSRRGIDSFILSPSISVILLTILTFTISFLLSKLIKSIPIVKFILP
ncbi:acyltransferase [Alkalibacterium pelagium]|uniref:Surface polysaccharide O-acyltransferase, integral membrane enzyme n=1 Tax=Alkalibacterium pelagium TaxID=426702 RepID=A0A1H7PNR0_9LACT|nr:acyltransferase family protein [Alkalibacterium pelagium]GEN51661.1 membrane protein [Alkalibacterium pelagium]SEL37098.1 Surface polysaccharide O-acyltransferase, integral membrane enzyme [Alkalibacterium pelagium]